MSRAENSQNKRSVNAIIAAVCIVILLGALLFVLYDRGVFNRFKQAETPSPQEGKAYVHYIDVGQGDSELIIADDGTTMLIDGGEYEYGAVVKHYLNELGIKKLDYVIATHPHSDHIGGLSYVISCEDLEVGKVYMPEIPADYVPTTNSFSKLLQAVADKGGKLSKADNIEFDFGSGKIYMYVSDYAEDNLNNYSILIKYVIGKQSFLFTGDIEAVIEKYYLDNEIDLDSTVLKVAHHGSSTSSTVDFLNAVSPEYCVIECGDNSYNHPNSNTVKRLRLHTDDIYRTDVQGTIVFTTDGQTISREFYDLVG